MRKHALLLSIACGCTDASTPQASIRVDNIGQRYGEAVVDELGIACTRNLTHLGRYTEVVIGPCFLASQPPAWTSGLPRTPGDLLSLVSHVTIDDANGLICVAQVSEYTQCFAQLDLDPAALARLRLAAFP